MGRTVLPTVLSDLWLGGIIRMFAAGGNEAIDRSLPTGEMTTCFCLPPAFLSRPHPGAYDHEGDILRCRSARSKTAPKPCLRLRAQYMPPQRPNGSGRWSDAPHVHPGLQKTDWDQIHYAQRSAMTGSYLPKP